jgi:hypothetical protein
MQLGAEWQARAPIAESGEADRRLPFHNRTKGKKK